MLKLEDVSTPEMAGAVINALAPSIISGRLKAFMAASGAPEPTSSSAAAEEETPTTHALKFIVNVSAMEGRFYKFKQPTHPLYEYGQGGAQHDDAHGAADCEVEHLYDGGGHGLDQRREAAAQAAADAQTHNFQTPIDEIQPQPACLIPSRAARHLQPARRPSHRWASSSRTMRSVNGEAQELRATGSEGWRRPGRRRREGCVH